MSDHRKQDFVLKATPLTTAMKIHKIIKGQGSRCRSSIVSEVISEALNIDVLDGSC